MQETVIRLCSEFDPVHLVTCDLPEKHKGPHSARVLWGDEEHVDE